MSDATTAERPPDACPECDTDVPARTAGDSATVATMERGSCTGCGLQLVRHRGERWREIRG